MTGHERAGPCILGRLRSAAGQGIVHMQDRLDAGPGEVWSALTDPRRLARWYGEVEGDLRPGGEYRFRVFASGAAGAGRVDACETPRRLLLAHGLGQPGVMVIEITLAVEGGQTVLVVEAQGMPLDQLPAYGAGIQIHVEDLTAHLTGRERCDADTRWDELQPAYDDLAITTG